METESEPWTDLAAQVKILFNVLLGLQLGKILHFNPQADNRIFILALLLWKISKHTKMERTLKESQYTSYPVSTIINSKLSLFHLYSTNAPAPPHSPYYSLTLCNQGKQGSSINEEE